MLSRLLAVIVVLCGMGVPGSAEDAPAALGKDEGVAAMHKAVGFFREEVSAEGGYLWRYSADLARREGEGKAHASTVWVQPPGTPSVGFAYLRAYERTGDALLLDAARDTAYALVNGQLASGGWDYRIYFDPKERQRCAYRVAPANEKGRNVSTLDDNTTQSALRFLMHVDQVLEFKDAKIHEAVTYGLECLLKAQYPNGAWPQRFTAPPDPAQFPVKKASYPDTWSRTHDRKNYTGYYTFNDNTIGDAISTMFDAARIYNDARYRASAEKAGGFIVLAQMPDPQPGWAQQYDPDMHPAWARKFEPPSITGGESQGAMRTLIQVYRETGDARFLEPLPKALAYYKKSLLPNGQLARFYELQTNTPLYFTKDYQLTYSDADMPTHYGFKVGSQLDAIEAEYEAVKKLDRAALKPPEAKRAYRMSDALAKQARQVVDQLDARGAWVQEGPLLYHGADDPTTHIIACGTFAKNLRVLSEFLAACD